MELTLSEKDDLRKVLEGIFGTLTVSKWNMNEKVLAITGQLVSEATQCSNATDFVPRPTFLAQPSYFKKYLKELARRRMGDRKIYEICRGGTLLKWKTRIEIASQGL